MAVPSDVAYCTVLVPVNGPVLVTVMTAVFDSSSR
jgi:hypothetical protein